MSTILAGAVQSVGPSLCSLGKVDSVRAIRIRTHGQICGCGLGWTYTSVLSRLLLGGAAPPNVHVYPPISASEAAAPPIRVMACKADLYSIVITKQLYTCKYTAIDCTIQALVYDRG